MENQKKEETRDTIFEKAKVGDRVWSIIYGWGTISHLDFGVRNNLPITVDYPTRGKKWYRLGGNTGQGMQELFWDEVRFSAPVRPIRRVKKTVTKYLNIYENDIVVWNSKVEAEGNATYGAVGVAVEFNYNYMEEE